MTSARPHINLKTKLHVALRQLGFDPSNVHLDHDPALELREKDPETGERIPHPNDPDYLVWREVEDHKDKTRGDVKRIAAKRREERKLDEKVEKQAKARKLQEAILRGEPVEKDMREPEKRKQKMQGPKLRRKNENGQKRASTPLKKTAQRFT